jgi:glycosyltransferase involved in cell wall biosynthesis
VATDVGAIPDIIENGETGLIVQSNNANALLEALIFLVNNVEIAMEMSKKAVDRTRKFFNWDSIIRKYEKICEELLRMN